MHVCHRHRAPLKHRASPSSCRFEQIYRAYTYRRSTMLLWATPISKIETTLRFDILRRNCAHRPTHNNRSRKSLTCKSELPGLGQGATACCIPPFQLFLLEREGILLDLQSGGWTSSLMEVADASGVFLFGPAGDCVDFKHQVCGRTCYPWTFKSATIFKWPLLGARGWRQGLWLFGIFYFGFTRACGALHFTTSDSCLPSASSNYQSVSLCIIGLWVCFGRN